MTLLTKSKLNGGVAILYDDSLRKAMAAAFADLDIKEWEFRGYEWTATSAREALLFEIQRLELSKQDIMKPRFIEHDNYTFSRVLVWYNLHIQSGGILPMLQELLPEYEFKRSEFDNGSRVNRDRDEAILEIRRVFEDVLDWSQEDIKEKTTLKLVQRMMAIPYRTFGQNIENMIHAAYPGIGDIHIHKETPEATKKAVLMDLSRGMKCKDIALKYNLSAGTVTKIKKMSSAASKLQSSPHYQDL